MDMEGKVVQTAAVRSGTVDMLLEAPILILNAKRSVEVGWISYDGLSY